MDRCAKGEIRLCQGRKTTSEMLSSSPTQCVGRWRKRNGECGILLKPALSLQCRAGIQKAEEKHQRDQGQNSESWAEVEGGLAWGLFWSRKGRIWKGTQELLKPVYHFFPLKWLALLLLLLPGLTINKPPDIVSGVSSYHGPTLSMMFMELRHESFPVFLFSVLEVARMPSAHLSL